MVQRLIIFMITFCTVLFFPVIYLKMKIPVKNEAIGITVVPGKGMHLFYVDYFQRIDHVVLALYWSGPGFTKQPVEAQTLSHSDLK